MNTFLSKFGDLIIGASAIAWAIAAQSLPSLAVIVSPEAAAAFGLVALGRGARALKAAE